MYAFRIVDGGVADTGVGNPARHPNLDSLTLRGESVGYPGQTKPLAYGRAEPRACYLAYRPAMFQDDGPIFGHRAVFHYEPDHPVAVTAFGDLLEGFSAYEIVLFELDCPRHVGFKWVGHDVGVLTGYQVLLLQPEDTLGLDPEG